MSREGMAEIRVFVTPDTRTEFKTICVSQNKTMSEVLTEMINQYIQLNKKESKNANV
jgi:hypothetical protein